MSKFIPNRRIAGVRENEDKQIILKDTWSTNASIDIESSVGRYIVIPTDYKQGSYHESNGCVQLSTRLVIKSQDSHLAEYLLIKYRKNFEAYNQLYDMEKGTKGCANLNIF